METQTKKFYMHKISNLLNIQKIVTIHYQALEKNYVFPEEKHDFWEINYADKGDVLVGVDGKMLELKQGEILFIKPNQPHFVESGNKEPNLFIVSFSCLDIHQSMDWPVEVDMTSILTYSSGVTDAKKKFTGST